MSWFKIIIGFIGLQVAGKVVRDSLPILDMRPLLRKMWHYIFAYTFLSYAYLLLKIKGPDKTQQTQLTILLAVCLLIIVYKMQKWEGVKEEQK